MYVQITTRCNMSCEHCCYACTADGEDMSLETFRNCLGLDSMIAIGGGEPTLHPQFWQFLGESLAEAEEYVWLATNGSQTQTALALAKLAKKGVIGCALSQDYYHDPIEQCVIDAFTTEPQGVRYSVGGYQRNPDDAREIRDVGGKEIRAGRCEDGLEKCPCEDLLVKPNGDIYACGCADAPCFGNVNTGYIIPEDWQTGECCHSQGND